MKGEELGSMCVDVLSHEGFAQFKPHEHIRLNQGVVQVVSFQSFKTDHYLWYMAQPLGYPRLNLSMGYEGLCSRLPKPAHTLSLKEMSEDAIKQRMRDELVSQAIPRLNQLLTLEQLDAGIAATPGPSGYYLRAYCLFGMGRFDAGRSSLSALLLHPRSDQWRVESERLLTADDATIKSEVEQLVLDNIKKHRLTRFVRAQASLRNS